jgi:hypothetical protein
MRLALAALILVCGCARVPVDVAEEQCFRAQMAGGSTRLTIGVGTGDWGGTGVSLSTDVPVGSADPAIGYATCVQRRSGQPPVTPFGARIGSLG